MVRHSSWDVSNGRLRTNSFQVSELFLQLLLLRRPALGDFAHAFSLSEMVWARSRRRPIPTLPVSCSNTHADIPTSNVGAVCGPAKYSETRINISQAFNGIGTVVAPVMGSYVFFKFNNEQALANVQWVYLAIAAFVFLLAFIFFMSDLPEITDADMAEQAEEKDASGASALPFRKQYRLFHAAFAQFCYTGAQVALAT